MTEFRLDDFLPYQLAVLASRVSAGFAARYRAKFGLSIPEWRVMAHLSQSGSVSVREIHERVDMDKSKVSRAATRLQTAGLVSKRTDPGDRRLVELALTDMGRALIAEMVPLARAYQAEVLQRLGTNEAQFRTAIAQLLKDTP